MPKAEADAFPLPPLPKGHGPSSDMYTVWEMTEYARLAIAAYITKAHPRHIPGVMEKPLEPDEPI
jgi:hypothetical protein